MSDVNSKNVRELFEYFSAWIGFEYDEVNFEMQEANMESNREKNSN